MDVFNLRDSIISDYTDYVRSFIHISNDAIRAKVEQEFKEGLLWPDPLLQLNPAFASGKTIDTLVEEGTLHEDCAKIFRVGKDDKNQHGYPMSLYKHQSDAIVAAQQGHNYVLTTGTGSGKSLSYIIPIVDYILKYKEKNKEKGIKAIIVYPMNALANSQQLELEKFLGRDGQFSISYSRYTGQETHEAREKIIAEVPDIILTNYVMLELILTRPFERSLIKAASQLQFLVFDELHTYRGRQGADVSMLIRRLRNMITELNQESKIQCIGTSATMAGADTFAEQRKEVSAVASKLFGAEVLPDNVIVESLKQETKCEAYGTDQFSELLREDVVSTSQLDPAKDSSSSTSETTEEEYKQFIQRPFVSWIEHTLGIRENEKEKGVLIRCTPRSISGDNGIATLLANETGLTPEECIAPIKTILLQGYQIKNPTTKKPVFAFRLHQFLNRGDTVYASLEPEETRSITLYAQHFAADREESVVLFPLFFCRECGKEYYRVWKTGDAKTGYTYLPYNPGYFDRDGSDDIAGYIFFDEKDNPWPSSKEEQLALLPEDWVEERKGEKRVKKTHKDCIPERIYIFKNGKAGTAKDKEASPAWFTVAPFSCCFGSCHTAYENKVKGDFSKLATLGTEGRSTATTILSLSTVRYLREEKGCLDDKAKKLLCFSDNRQDASLQAGHFNDFMEVGLIRSALFNALEKAEDAGLQYDVLATKVFEAMGLGEEDGVFPIEYYSENPDVAADSYHAKDVRSAFINLLKYRIYSDLRRGWRIVAPNLEQCGLLTFDYKDLDTLCKSDDCWRENSFLFNLTPEKRKELTNGVLLFMRQHLAINIDCLTEDAQRLLQQQSVQLLSERWKIDPKETLSLASRIYPRSRGKEENRKSNFGAIYVSTHSNLGKWIRRQTAQESPLSALDTSDVIATLFTVLTRQGILVENTKDKKHYDPWYQIQASSMIWKAGDGTKGSSDPLRMTFEEGQSARTNPFFVHLYRNVARQGLHIEAREHTAQVPSKEREAREEAFRDAELPILYCSPTMELGVDISQLNAVAMRNVPPTPANYAQRSGRAGRSGQPALIFTYCSRGNSHDQHFFQRPEEMVAGSVSTPRIDLANEDLIRAHVHAIWLTKADLNLKNSIHELINIDLDVEKTPEGETGLLLQTKWKDEQEIALNERLPLQESIDAALHSDGAVDATFKAASQILEDMKEEFVGCGWYTKDWLGEIVTRISKDFEDACDRWRVLFHSARLQQYKQNIAANDYRLSPQDRKIAQRLRREAESQISILLQEKNQGEGKESGDFYPYRYFASEGFLPGYNFPRLPLSAYIPGDSAKQKDDTYISRARFLAISEFGPSNIIYYEGNKYTIRRVIMDTPSENEPLATASYKFCSACGYVHGTITDKYNPDICEFCGEPLPQEMTNLFRMRNVVAEKRERITSDEEERSRYGYDLRTGFRFVEHGGVKSHRDATAYRIVDKDPLIKMQYGHGAVLWRINLGWRNRTKEKSPGFYFNPVQGTWVDDKNSPNSKQTIENMKDGRVERIIPYVQDRKNCLLLTPISPLLTDPEAALSLLGEEDKIADISPEDLVPAVLYSLQSALKQAIQIVYQLEDMEIATEVLPATGTPKYILFIESAEGGAGVLRRLVDDKNAIATVAKEALRICHFSEEGENLLKSPHAKENCVRACYDCLMNYANQRVHNLLNRHIIVNFLLQLAQSTIDTAEPAMSRTEQLEQLKSRCDSQLEKDWLQFLFNHNYRLPDKAQYYIETCHTKPDFWYEESGTAIYIDGPVHDYADIAKKDAEQEECLEEYGIGVLRFAKGEQWQVTCKEYPDIFGTQE